MKIYKSIAFASLVIGTVLCIVGFFMNGISELPDETQKLSKYVTIRSFGKARNVSMEMRVDDSCDLSLELSAVNGTIKYYDGEVIKVEADNVDRDYEFKYDGVKANISFDGVNNKKQAGNAILLACKEYDGQDKKYIGEYRGFDLYIQFNSLSQYYIMSLKKELYYPVELGNDVYGNLTRIDNAIENIPKSLKVEKELLQNTLQQLHNAELEVEKPFEKEDELNNALKKLSKINKELDLDKKENIPDTSVQKNDTGVGHKSKVNRMR